MTTPPSHDNPYPADSRITRLETRVDSIDHRVAITEANWARLDERSARIADDVGVIRKDVHEGLARIDESVTHRFSGFSRWAFWIGTLLIATLVAVIVDLGWRL